jgi:hypothetical protein
LPPRCAVCGRRASARRLERNAANRLSGEQPQQVDVGDDALGHAVAAAHDEQAVRALALERSSASRVDADGSIASGGSVTASRAALNATSRWAHDSSPRLVT